MATSSSSLQHATLSVENAKPRLKSTRTPDVDINVPDTLEDAVALFIKQPTVLGAMLAIVCLGYYRLSSPLTPTDALVAGITMCFWSLQEWWMHKYALHSKTDWFGRRIHLSHHRQPYHHVCVDGPPVVFGGMLVSAIILKIAFWNQCIGDTAILSYWGMIMVYVWTHYLVHTKYIPKNSLFRTIRQNHMRHHCKDSRFWFSFTAPALDVIMGTDSRS